MALVLGAVLSTSGALEAQARSFTELAEQSLAQIEGTLDVPGLRAPVEVLRDRWGVAHIYAQNQHDLFFAQGYVQAQDRLWQMDMWRRINEGRLAEILGPEGLRHDRLARLIRFRGDWEEEFGSYHPDGKLIFQAFADGVNAYIAAIGDNLPVEYEVTGLRPLPWTPESSTGRVATALPIGQARRDLRLAQQVAERGLAAVDRDERVGMANWIPLRLPEGLDPSIITDDVIRALGGFDARFPEPPLLPEYRDWPGAVSSLNTGAQTSSPGSNNWVVSGERTATGGVLLANDPHRGVANPSLRYLIHLNAPGYSVIGATEPAIPGVAIGHNGRVGWGLTIVGTDQADVFVEQLDRNLDEALWKGEWYPLETVVDTILVKGQAPEIVELRYSRHGPVFYTDSVNHTAYALRATSNVPGSGGYLAALRLAEVEDCHEFIDALAYYFAPSENMVCGDVDGNIAWLAAALSPDRSGDGWYGRLPVPGTGAYAWDGFRSHTELPQEFNPERGWIGTSNNDVQPEGYYPPIMFRSSVSSRWDRQLQMFAENGYGLTVEDFEEMQHDAVHPWFVERDLPLLRGWVSESPDVEWARWQLARWDGVYHRVSPAPAIHYYWRRALDEEAREGGVSRARRHELTESALAAALDMLRETQGEDRGEWRWGRINRSEFPHTFIAAYDLPAVERSGDGGTIFDAGATFREIIDFSDFDNSRATSTPGQSMQPGSPFYGNLLPLWADEEYFPLLYTREAVESDATHRLNLKPPGLPGPASADDGAAYAPTDASMPPLASPPPSFHLPPPMNNPRIDNLRRMLERHPDDARLRFGLALEHEKLEQWDDAAEQLEQYLQLTEDEGNAWGRLGEALRRMGREEEAKEAYRTGIEAAHRHNHPTMAAEFEQTLADWDG